MHPGVGLCSPVCCIRQTAVSAAHNQRPLSRVSECDRCRSCRYTTHIGLDLLLISGRSNTKDPDAYWQACCRNVAAGPSKPHKTASRLGPAAAAAAAAGPYAGVCAAAEQLFGSIRSTVALQVPWLQGWFRV